MTHEQKRDDPNAAPRPTRNDSTNEILTFGLADSGMTSCEPFFRGSGAAETP